VWKYGGCLICLPFVAETKSGYFFAAFTLTKKESIQNKKPNMHTLLRQKYRIFGFYFFLVFNIIFGWVFNTILTKFKNYAISPKIFQNLKFKKNEEGTF